MTLAAIINGTEGRPKCHNRQNIARDFGQTEQIIKYQALWKSCPSLPFTRGSAAAGRPPPPLRRHHGRDRRPASSPSSGAAASWAASVSAVTRKESPP